MKENSLAKRYARALIKAMDNEAEFRRSQADIATFCSLMENNHTFKVAMITSICNPRQKRELIDSIHDKMQFSEKMRRFFYTVLEENRMAVLPQIANQLEILWNEAQHIEKIYVFSAIPLDAGRLSRLRDNLAHAFHSTVELENKIDTQLLAGLRIERASNVYDFSLAANLNTLRDAIAGE